MLGRPEAIHDVRKSCLNASPGDDRKGESPPDEIGPIPVDIQIGLIPAVAAMLRPDSRDLRLNAGAVVATVYNRFWLTDH